MPRIVGGVARGRRLAVATAGTRPTSDRAREGLFSTLVSLRGDLTGARLLDLYAGTGAVGLEALSRGAAAALLVESQPAALRALRANVAALALPGATVLAERVERAVAGPPPGEPFDVCFADPPYALAAARLAATLAALPAAGWLTTGALVVVERASREDAFPWPPNWAAVRTRRYGEATLWYGRAAR